MPSPWTTSEPDLAAIGGGRHGDPFNVPGLHQVGGDCVARASVPGGALIDVTALSEIVLPGVAEGGCYKYEILGISGNLLPLKADPFGFWAELRPKTASRVAPTDNFTWNDGKYLENRKGIDLRRSPISIYEAHLGSWRRHP